MIIIRWMKWGRRKKWGGKNYMYNGKKKYIGINGREKGKGKGEDMEEEGFRSIGWGEGWKKLRRKNNSKNLGRCRKVWIKEKDKFLEKVIEGI